MYKKAYIGDEKLFTFGPLLIITEEDVLIDEEKEIYLSSVKDYQCKIRFTNISPFTIKINFTLEDIIELTEEKKEELAMKELKSKKNKGKQK